MLGILWCMQKRQCDVNHTKLRLNSDVVFTRKHFTLKCIVLMNKFKLFWIPQQKACFCGLALQLRYMTQSPSRKQQSKKFSSPEL